MAGAALVLFSSAALISFISIYSSRSIKRRTYRVIRKGDRAWAYSLPVAFTVSGLFVIVYLALTLTYAIYEDIATVHTSGCGIGYNTSLQIIDEINAVKNALLPTVIPH